MNNLPLPVHNFCKTLHPIFVLVLFTVFTLPTSKTAWSKDELPAGEQQIESLFMQKNYRAITEQLWKQFKHLKRNQMLQLIRAHHKLKEPEKMIKIAEMLISKNPKDYMAYSYLGYAHLIIYQDPLKADRKTAEKVLAVENFQKSLEIKPKNQTPYDGLIELYEGEDNLNELRQIYLDLIKIKGERAEYLTKLCEIEARDSLYENAIAYCEQAIKKNKSLPDNYVHLAESYFRKGEVDKGKRDLQQAADRFSNSVTANLAYANLLQEEKNFQDGLKYYHKAILADNKSAKAWLGYAQCNFEIQSYEESVKGFSQACKLDKKSVNELRRAANILRNSGNLKWQPRFDYALDHCH